MHVHDRAQLEAYDRLGFIDTCLTVKVFVFHHFHVFIFYY